MSTAREDRFRFGGVAVSYHWLAVASTAVLVASYLSVFYHITSIVGGKNDLLLVVAGAVVAATVLARKLPAWIAFVLGALLLGGGLLSYYSTVPGATFSQTSRIVADNVALLTGLSILQMREVGTWALGVAPATVFVPWYLVFRRRYVLAAVSGGVALGFFVLTSDAGSFVTLAGMLGILGILAFGTMTRYGGSVAQIDVLAVALVAIVLLSTTVSLVPGGSASPILPTGGGGTGGGGGLLSNSQNVAIQGSIELSPKVQYTVTANHASYWRVAAYDRYTGTNWVRTDGSQPYSRQSPPPGESYEIRQTFTVEATSVTAMPAAWKPIRVVGNAKDGLRIGSDGSLSPRRALTNGETYSVVSRVPTKRASQLRNAGTDYPSAVERRYTTLPASTSERLRGKTGEITAEADNPYESAVAIERWLETNKGYSLNVDKPKGDVANNFVFEMEEGYCVYYATSMVAMLRSQGIPARFVTGYTSGQRVAEDRWVVRGLDSHAWVEVYFPDTGWVRFDPTPGGPRSAAEQEMVSDAREENVSGVDASGSENGTWTPEPTTTTTTTTDDTDTTNDTQTGPDVDEGQRGDPALGDGESVVTTNGSANTTAVGGGGIPIRMPSTAQLLYGWLLFVGVMLTARRTGVLSRVYRALWVRWQPRDDPETDVERAFDRLEYHLAQRHRQRRPGETPREYIAALSHVGVDERARRVGTLYERARYAGEVTSEQADEAVSLVDDIVRGSKRRNMRG